jgi:hypothetical protein
MAGAWGVSRPGISRTTSTMHGGRRSLDDAALPRAYSSAPAMQQPGSAPVPHQHQPGSAPSSMRHTASDPRIATDGAPALPALPALPERLAAASPEPWHAAAAAAAAAATGGNVAAGSGHGLHLAGSQLSEPLTSEG